jgi:phospholipase/carboxylesterase
MPSRAPIELQSGPNPTASLIILHGLGADGSDFVPVCEALDLAAVGDLRFVLPHADEMPVTVNGGYVMPAWYDIRSSDLLQREDDAGLRRSQAVVQALVDHEIARGVAAERIVLMGFSQGCAMTLMTGLRCPHRLAGLVGLSGYLPLAPLTAAERHAANADTPVFLAHGRHDAVVPLQRATASRDALRALGHEVEWHDYAMEHSVCPQEIADLQHWLLGVLGAARTR